MKGKRIRKSHVHSDIDAVAHLLIAGMGSKEEKIPDLTTEMVLSAMWYLRDNPGASIDDACAFGVAEWDK